MVKVSILKCYEHNYNIHIPGNLSNSGNNVDNVQHNEANVSSSNDHYFSEMDIEEDLTESDKREENNEPQSDNEQNSYEDSFIHSSPLKSLDVDEKIFMPSIVGKSIFHEEKLTLLNKQPCQPSKALLSKRKKNIGKRD